MGVAPRPNVGTGHAGFRNLLTEGCKGDTVATAETTKPKGAIESGLTPDNIFELLVQVANTSEVELGVTLHVQGQVLTGKLISGETYWSETADRLRAQGAGPTKLVETLATSMDRVADEYRSSFGEDEPDDAGDPKSHFLHLRDARTLTPEGPVPTDGALWRGRIASIDGFSVGELRARSSLESGN
jgi:hypothetical protein